MRSLHGVTTCQWGTPTLSLPYPLWLAAEDRPWSCTRTSEMRALDLTDVCADCPQWTPVPAPPHCGPKTDADHNGADNNGAPGLPPSLAASADRRNLGEGG